MSEPSALSDWGPLATIIGVIVAAVAFLWNAVRNGREDINGKIASLATAHANLERAQDDDRGQMRAFELEIARNYVTKRDREADDNRLAQGITELTREFNQLKTFLMEKGYRP